MCFFVQMAKLDLNDESEKKLVEGVFESAMDSLSNDDKKLPQVYDLLCLFDGQILIIVIDRVVLLHGFSSSQFSGFSYHIFSLCNHS